MKRCISHCEWYPVYVLYDNEERNNIEIPKEKLEWIEKVFEEFDKVQDYLKEL